MTATTQTNSTAFGGARGFGRRAAAASAAPVLGLLLGMLVVRARDRARGTSTIE